MPRPKKHPAVEAEINEAARWYNERCPGLGVQFIDAVREAARAVERNPLRYAVRFADIRRANVNRFPYAVWFFLERETAFVISVLHNKRDHRALLGPRRSEV